MFTAERLRFTVQGLGFRVKRRGDVPAANVVAWYVIVAVRV